MELSEFVEETFSEIERGSLRAREKSSANGIAPGGIGDETVFAEQTVAFDVVVTTEKGASGGAKILVVGDAGGTATTSESQRIRFTVPVVSNSIIHKNRLRNA
jgi:hypothetical protein